MYPWQCLRFLRAECQNHPHSHSRRHEQQRRRRRRPLDRSVVELLLGEVKLHPGLLRASKEELGVPDWRGLPPLQVEAEVGKYDLDAYRRDRDRDRDRDREEDRRLDKESKPRREPEQ